MVTTSGANIHSTRHRLLVGLDARFHAGRLDGRRGGRRGRESQQRPGGVRQGAVVVIPAGDRGHGLQVARRGARAAPRRGTDLLRSVPGLRVRLRRATNSAPGCVAAKGLRIVGTTSLACQTSITFEMDTAGSPMAGSVYDDTSQRAACERFGELMSGFGAERTATRYRLGRGPPGHPVRSCLVSPGY